MGAVAAGISAVGSILGGITGGKGAAKAARIQAKAYKQGLAQQQAQFDVTQKNVSPWIQGGDSALQQILTLLGIGGGDQQGAIDALKASPLFTSLYNTGSDTILQNASATGGLRGGNTQNSLANFGSSLLAQVIQNQLANLGGVSGLGESAATGLGQISQQNSNAQSQAYGQIGNANATAAAAPYAALQGIIGQLTGGGGGSLQNLFGGGGSKPAFMV